MLAETKQKSNYMQSYRLFMITWSPSGSMAGSDDAKLDHAPGVHSFFFFFLFLLRRFVFFGLCLFLRLLPGVFFLSPFMKANCNHSARGGRFKRNTMCFRTRSPTVVLLAKISETQTHTHRHVTNFNKATTPRRFVFVFLRLFCRHCATKSPKTTQSC